jgi:hypothetical protein
MVYSPNENIRLRASEDIIDLVVKLQRQEELEERVRELEERLEAVLEGGKQKQAGRGGRRLGFPLPARGRPQYTGPRAGRLWTP